MLIPKWPLLSALLLVATLSAACSSSAASDAIPAVVTESTDVDPLSRVVGGTSSSEPEAAEIEPDTVVSGEVTSEPTLAEQAEQEPLAPGVNEAPPSSQAGTEEVAGEADSAGPPGNIETGTDVPDPVAALSVPVPEIGDSGWAVVVAGASDPFDPLLSETIQLVQAQGHDTTITNCDGGAAESIGMQPLVSFTVSAYSFSEAGANELAESLDIAGLPGTVVEITVACP